MHLNQNACKLSSICGQLTLATDVLRKTTMNGSDVIVVKHSYIEFFYYDDVTPIHHIWNVLL